MLEELKRRVESAEETFKAAQLDARLQEFEEARRRQVRILSEYLYDNFISFLDKKGRSSKAIHRGRQGYQIRA